MRGEDKVRISRAHHASIAFNLAAVDPDIGRTKVGELQRGLARRALHVNSILQPAEAEREVAVAHSTHPELRVAVDGDGEGLRMGGDERAQPSRGTTA